ncbi:MAG: stage III sporulation protein AB [Clostridia bacterium]|nr:stage III sporulation protein AB [Clostridia bacterium]
MLKTLGIILILSGSFGGAVRNVKFQKNKLYINEAFLDFITYVRNRIFFFHENLNDVYNSYENCYLQKNGFINLIPEVGFGEALRLSGAIECFDKKMQSVLLNFGSRLGKSGVDEQLANCDSCTQQLEQYIEKMRIEIPNKIKMYSSLSVISGLGISLMLI